MNAKTWLLWLTCVLLSGCGASDYTGLEPSEDDPTEVEWGHPYPVDDVDQSEKTNVIMLHGWSVESYLTTRQGLQGWEPVDANWTDLDDAVDNLQGRCGRYDGFVENHWKACVMPWGRVGVGKTWSWGFDWTNCPANNTLRTALIDGAVRAFAAAQFATGWTFTQTSLPNPNITIMCTNALDTQLLRANSAIAAGIPFGTHTFRHSATISHVDVCEQPDSTGAEFFMFADQMWSYTKGRIYLNWEDAWNFINPCPEGIGNLPEMRRRGMHHIVMHELGHILGFQHQSDTSAASNVMYKTRSCSRFWNTPASFRQYVREALQFYDFPNNEEGSLQLHDVDLSCYSPL